MSTRTTEVALNLPTYRNLCLTSGHRKYSRKQGPCAKWQLVFIDRVGSTGRVIHCILKFLDFFVFIRHYLLDIIKVSLQCTCLANGELSQSWVMSIAIQRKADTSKCFAI